MMLVMTAILLATPTLADDKNERRRKEPDVHQDQVLEALQRGEIRPLAEVLAAAEKVMPGQVLGVKVKRKEGRLVYELKILAGRGRLREVYVDATNLDIIKVE
jgi:uncharacterized membrane protein YkoI